MVCTTVGAVCMSVIGAVCVSSAAVAGDARFIFAVLNAHTPVRPSISKNTPNPNTLSTMTMLIENPINRDKASAFQVVECHNLRPADASGEVLCPTGIPRTLLSGGWRPLACIDTSAGKRLALCRDTEIAVAGITSGTDTATVTTIGNTAGTPLCAVFDDGGDSLTVMSTSGAYVAQYADGAWMMARADSSVWPAISIIAESAGDISVTLPARVLSREYSSGMPLAATDRKALAADIGRAYIDALDSANAAGTSIAPCLARCRLLDDEGNTLYTTPPVLLAADVADPFTAAISYDCADSKTLAAKTLTVRSFRPRVTVGAGADALRARRAARLVLEMTAPMPPIDPSGVDVRASFGRTPGTGYVRISICGTAGVAAARPAASRRHVAEALARFDECARAIAAVSRPLSQGRWSRTFDMGDGTTCTPPQVPAAALPGGFVAETCAKAAGATLWGGIHAVRPGAYSPVAYAAALADKAWSGRVRVSFADGHRDVVWRGSGTADAPVRLSPLLVYPHPSAVKIQIDLDIDGTHYRHTATMEASGDGAYAFAVDSSMQPVTPVAEADPGDDATAAGDVVVGVVRGLVAATRPGTLMPCSTLTLPADIRTLATAPSSGGAWDYGRSRFYCGSGDGIRMVTVGVEAKSMSATLISNSIPVGARSMCAADDAVYVLCHGHIDVLRGTRVETITTDIPLGGSELLWLPQRRELAVFAADQDTYIYSSRHNRARYSVDNPGVIATLGATDCALATTSEGRILDYDNTVAPTGNTAVRWNARTPMGPRSILRTLTWNIDAADVDGDLTAERMYLSPRHLCVSRTSYTGAMRTPLTVVTAARRITSLWLGIDAGVSADARIAAPTYTVIKQ